MPVDNELAHQNMQDRYHGRNDPVARKIMSGHAEAQGLKPPDDVAVVSIL
jgi:pre-mRNA-splicing factor RBM22/SLT11